MTSREQFEEWVTKETGFDLWRTEFPMTEWDDQQYKCHQTNLAWMAWQASRAEVEIKLPTENELHQKVCSQCASESLEMVEEAIRSSGIKVKDC
ncbi:TPA: hypothetical protein NDT34_002003 [Citrobacter freundii]|nr:hypothetical protein [Citrobacter freundii]HBD3031924.1 hypothetical protein [Citrobacter koseri]HBB6752227.1 hypothetical protein [Citrobacter freundii]HBD3035974.1 hypothetical protein [Citrobacter koseri]HBD3187605.1 hypothetical protein [Citrobacter koseri]